MGNQMSLETVILLYLNIYPQWFCCILGELNLWLLKGSWFCCQQWFASLQFYQDVPGSLSAVPSLRLLPFVLLTLDMRRELMMLVIIVYPDDFCISFHYCFLEICFYFILKQFFLSISEGLKSMVRKPKCPIQWCLACWNLWSNV